MVHKNHPPILQENLVVGFTRIILIVSLWWIGSQAAGVFEHRQAVTYNKEPVGWAGLLRTQQESRTVRAGAGTASQEHHCACWLTLAGLV